MCEQEHDCSDWREEGGGGEQICCMFVSCLTHIYAPTHSETAALCLCACLCVVQDILEGLQSAEPMAEKLKSQLNDLVRFSRDLGQQSDRVTAVIKQHNR